MQARAFLLYVHHWRSRSFMLEVELVMFSLDYAFSQYRHLKTIIGPLLYTCVLSESSLFLTFILTVS